MPSLKKADIEQINDAVRTGNINAARRILSESHDVRAAQMLAQLNAKYPPPRMAPDVDRPVDRKSASERLPWEDIDEPAALPKIERRLSKPPAAPAPAQPAFTAPPPTLLTDLDGMEDIKQAIRDKRFDDARAMLVLSDHPDADKMLARLSQISSSGEKVKRVYDDGEGKDFTAQLTITIFLLFFLGIFGLIALAVWLPEAKRYPNAPGAQGLILTNKVVTFILRAILALILFVIVLSLLGVFIANTQPRYIR